jgi:hypothetical protein
MICDDSLSDVQPKAGPFSERLCGKERLRQHGDLMGGNSHPLIAKYDPHIRAVADSYFLAGDLEAFIFMPSRILLV